MALTAKLLAVILLGQGFTGAASTASSHVVHESRGHVPAGWNLVRRAEPEAILPFRFGLAQSNIEHLETFLMDVSHPESPNYGKHWSPAQVAEGFRPSSDTIDVVRSWLVDSGLSEKDLKLSASGQWLQANISIEDAEFLLNTEYYVYQHLDGYEHIACHEKYHLPEHVSRHVEIVTPTLHFDVKPRRAPVHLDKRSISVGGQYTSAHSVGQPGLGASFPNITGDIKGILSDLKNCDVQITPDCLRALYDFTYTPNATEKNSIAIVEYTPQAYVPSDLDIFFEMFSPSQVGERPVLYSIDGGFIQTNQTGVAYNRESNLDLQYAMTLVGGSQPVQLYQAGDDVEGASFGNLLDALDASFCTFEGGDSSIYDATYPDPYGGYQGPLACGTVTPAYVISTSYVYDEADLTPAYEERQCAEYAKLGLMGITVLYSSGDFGVAGNQNVCLGTNSTGFNPSFPGTCPYVTSVGATQVNPNSTVFDPEGACEQVIYSGGGFSNVFAMPSYQQAAVEHYLANYPPPYSSAQYNSSGTSRAIPDISANGANYAVAVQGEWVAVYGTSCATPVSATMFAAINDARLAAGKAPIGFINPTIYTPKFMDAFNDITTGSNPGCGTEGFPAEPGWDPVTGIGTPNFKKLLQLWLDLP
ncbi:subtilisin-like protein [Wolfiporia cocos MD-104 SS10]|uniref:tripeptidyl-peptidase II n=1 Tax=Wolfiporia cocos (strain MD-104) TaxID=742152 RepID=A0A2H3JFK7_WOLCO|nr:subtilisin-like protein [Wolfiporia cocos MD-104 SS10]